VSGVVLTVFPLTAAVSGAPVHLRPDWLWLLIGLFAFHGLAEELVWRGFAFRRLREGRSFWAAVWWTMPLIAATHVPIVLTLGPAIGVGAMAVAAVTSIPFAYLYETGRRSIWAPGLVHTAIDTFKLVVIPAVAVATFLTAAHRRQPRRPAARPGRPAAAPGDEVTAMIAEARADRVMSTSSSRVGPGLYCRRQPDW
jgi:membrane protease YdiL (CAAX protease family)